MPCNPMGLVAKRSDWAILPFATNFFHSGVPALSFDLSGELLLDLRSTELSLTIEPVEDGEEKVCARSRAGGFAGLEVEEG